MSLLSFFPPVIKENMQKLIFLFKFVVSKSHLLVWNKCISTAEKVF